MTNTTTITFNCEKHYTRMSDSPFEPDYVPDYSQWWRNLPEDERSVYQEELQAYEAKLQAARDFADRKKALAESGVPRKDIGQILAGEIVETAALGAVRKFAASRSTILVLLGPRGVGKTFAASWLTAATEDDIVGGLARKPCTYSPRTPDVNWERAFRGPRARFITAAQLARTSMYDEKAMSSLERVGLLVIDDLGVEYKDEKGAFLSLFDGLFNARYSNRLRTLITTNLTASEFRGRYGERVVDRIRESGKFIGLDGESLRG